MSAPAVMRNYFWGNPDEYFVDCNDDHHLARYYNIDESCGFLRPEEKGVKCPYCPKIKAEQRRKAIEDFWTFWVTADRAATIIKRHIRGYIARKNYSCPNPTTEIGQRRLLAIFNTV